MGKQRIKIMYVDDEADLCEIFSDKFSSDLVEVITFTVPDQAIGQIQTIAPDLIFLDYRLPGTSGDEVAQKMRATAPVYLVTGEIKVDTQFKFSGVLPKPYKDAEMLSIITSAIESSKKS